MSWRKLSLWVLGICVCSLTQAKTIQFDSFSDSQEAVLEKEVVPNGRGLSNIRLRLNIPQMDLNDDKEGFASVDVVGLKHFATIGSPELLTTGSLLAVPPGYEVKVQLVQQKKHFLKDTVVRPAQKKLRCDCPELLGFSFNAPLYESKAQYPASILRLEKVGNFHGVELVRVGFYPAQMDFNERSLSGASLIEAEVSFVKTGESRSLQLPNSIYKSVQASVANSEDFAKFAMPAGKEVMVFFVADALVDATLPLINAKKEQGFDVQVVTLTQAGGTKESILAFVKNLYETAVVKPTYFLFVGNKDTMPVYKESTSNGPAASDYRYTLLAGNDEIPDVFYGRLVADNEADVATQVQRILDYPKNNKKDAWMHEALTIASSGAGMGLSDKEYAESVATDLKAMQYTKVDTFLEMEETAKKADISKSLNEGRHWLAYFGHGDGTSWPSTNDNFNIETIRELTNTGKLPVIIDVACDNASWVEIDTCFGKAWVTHQVASKPAGAVAFYGGSVIISWDPPAIMSQGIAKARNEKKIASLGASVAAGQLFLIEKMGKTEATIENWMWYNLFGDPSMALLDLP